jgi:hypothetical protein
MEVDSSTMKKKVLISPGGEFNVNLERWCLLLMTL